MRRLSMPSPSMAVSLVALTVSLGGTSYAAVQLTSKDVKNNSLTGSDIRNSSLTGADVKGSSLTGSDVKSSSLTGSDIKNGSLGAADFSASALPKGATGATGPAGPKGDTGAAGPQGPAGAGRWVLVGRDGKIEAQSGGFRIANAYPAGSPGEGNVYIDSGDADLSNNGIVASIALVNQYSLKGDGVTPTSPEASVDGTRLNGRNPGADANPEFSGEITATRCAITGVVGCAPVDTTANGGDGASTNRAKYFVVSPRNSDGSLTVNDSAAGANDNTHKRFYVIITGPQD